MPIDAHDVAGLVLRAALEHTEDGLRACPSAKQILAAPVMGDESEDVEIGQRLAWSPAHLRAVADAALAVDEATFLFSPTCGW